MEHDPRYIALLILLENSKTKIPLDTVLNNFYLELEALSKLDRSLANAIIYGTLRQQAYLDWIIEPFSDRKIKTLKTEVLYIIRIAMFQIIFMDKIPVSAAVNMAVESAKKISHQGVAGFVNAVLRKASIQFSGILFPDFNLEPELNISVTKSMPVWLVRKWITKFGFDKTLKLCESINNIPPLTIRTNTLKIDREALLSLCVSSSDAEQIKTTNYSLYGINFTKLLMPIHETKAFKNGFFQVQDEAAQLASVMLNPVKGERILDACAGLGGKTGHIAQLMDNDGLIIACDTDSVKLQSLEKEMNRLGVDIVKTSCKDILKSDLNDFDNIPFDKILVDAPCSGMGVLRRNPDAKWKRTKKDIARLGIRQEKLLLNAANLVKSGGTILYVVCSCETRENEDVIDNFLKQRPDFIVKKEISGTEAEKEIIEKIMTEKGYFRTYPDYMEMDGFFAALMERKTN